MAICLCLRVTPTPAKSIHSNSNVAIYRSEIDSVTFGIFCVISDTLTSRLHSCLHTMVLRSSVLLINTTSQTYPDAYMDAMYAGSPVISSMDLVSYVDASCSSYRIPSTNCLTPVDFLGSTMMVIFQVLHLLAWIAPLPLGCQYLCGGILPGLRTMFLNSLVPCSSLLSGLARFFMFI